VHHEGGAGEAALPIPRRAVDRSQDRGRQGQNCRSAATSLESAPRGEREVLTAASQRWFPPASGLDALAPESGLPAMGNQYHYLTLCALMRASAAPGAADFLFRPQTDFDRRPSRGKLGNFGGFATPSVTQRNDQNQMQAISMRYMTLSCEQLIANVSSAAANVERGDTTRMLARPASETASARAARCKLRCRNRGKQNAEPIGGRAPQRCAALLANSEKRCALRWRRSWNAVRCEEFNFGADEQN
jgi:hypothetical protein